MVDQAIQIRRLHLIIFLNSYSLEILLLEIAGTRIASPAQYAATISDTQAVTNWISRQFGASSISHRLVTPASLRATSARRVRTM